MGHGTHSKLNLSKEDIESSKEILNKFTSGEKKYLVATFKDLAQRSPGPTIDRKTFLETFKLPGLYGEQLFNIFDFKKTGVIDYLEFVTGLATCLKGSPDEKLEILFNLFDISSDGSVSRKELCTMLHQVPKDVLLFHRTGTAESDKALQKQELVNLIVKEIFTKYDVKSSGTLSPDQFRIWLEDNPKVVNILDSVFNVIANSSVESPFEVVLKKKESSSTLSVHSGDTSLPTRVKNLFFSKATQNLSVESDLSSFGVSRNGSSVYEPVEVDKEVIKQGELQKVGKISSLLKTRFCVIRKNVFCSFKSKKCNNPPKVVLLTGCFIEELNEEKFKRSNLFAFCIRLPYNQNFSEKGRSNTCSSERDKREDDNSREEMTKVLYCKSALEREGWIRSLKESSKHRKFEEHFEMSTQIGSGKFANVYKCLRKSDGEVFAVKLLERKFISPQERELLRTEIAILRLLEHDNVVKLVDVFETGEYIYIVTELVTGGELFEFISGRPRFDEQEAFILVQQLLEGLSYLHSAGIIHRDLKPENILLQWNSEEDKTKRKLLTSTKIKLTDFGLSKMVHPEQKLDMPCGTIAYVAPEVLSSSGYDLSADLWSIGVILFLVLRGKLPFDGDSSNDILEQMELHALDNSKIFKDETWSKHPQDLVDFIKLLLHSTSEQRTSADDLKQHKWMERMSKKE